MRHALELDLLQTLIAIADSGSFAEAATRIHRTQSAVSMQMRRLESIVGKPVFDREGRRTKLSPTGETLLAYARRIVDLQDEAFTILDENFSAGTVKLGVMESYFSPLLPAILARFAETHPGIEVVLHCDSNPVLRQLVTARELDLALVVKRSSTWSDVESLRHEPLVWVASHDFDHTQTPIPVALPQQGCPIRDHALKSLARGGRDHRIAYSGRNFSGLLVAVRAGLAVSLVTQLSVPPDLRILDERHGFPRLPMVEIGLLRAVDNAASTGTLADCIAASLEDELWQRPVRRAALGSSTFIDRQ